MSQLDPTLNRRVAEALGWEIVPASRYDTLTDVEGVTYLLAAVDAEDR